MSKMQYKDVPVGNLPKSNDNPWGLVYQGAITRNESGKVNLHPISYVLNGLKIAANIYTPAGYDPSKKYAAIVVAHPNGGVKEQVAGLYGQHLAENGYVAIVADASYQGASEGQPRNVDKPQFRVEDIHGMADIISVYPGADPERIGIFGICGGGGYTLRATQTDKRFKVIVTLSAFNSGVVRRNGFLDSQVNTIQERLQQATAACAQEAAGGEVLYSADLLDLTDEQAKALPYDLYREGYEYYGKTHRHPNSTFKYTLSSLLDLFTFDASENMDLINQPLLMMAGSIADTFYLTEKAFAAATGTNDKELFLIKGATHIQTYWKPEYVAQAVEKAVDFFDKRL
ncbi:MAG: alpha/beta hydrolase [Clostridiaceae bacterium]|nr:alpha/beta hydrolase [Clostridiaceae bacterium]